MMLQIFNKDIVEVLTVFCLSPGSKFLRREIKEKTKLNNVNLDNALNILLNSRLIKKNKRYIFLNLEESKLVVSLLSSEYKQLKELPLNVYFSIIELLFYLSKWKKVSVYLFGSYAKLIFHEKSDIDLAIIYDKLITEQKKELNKLISKIEKKHSTKIEPHFFGKSFYKNKKDPLVKDILKNGVKLI